MNILSLHSQVVAGHVGNSAAVLPLQLLGIDVWAVPTVLYSNHPGHGTFTGRVTPVEEIAALVDGLDQRGLLRDCHGVLVGYLGDAAQATGAAEAIARVRRLNPNVMVCCDPVLGDRDSGRYVGDRIPDAVAAALIPSATLATPNQFELEALTGASIQSLDDGIAAARQLARQGPDIVVCTSFEHGGGAPDQVDTLMVTSEDAWIGRNGKVPEAPHGVGDLTAALLLGHRILGRSPEDALSAALSTVWSIIAASTNTPDHELALVAGQANVTAPQLIAMVQRVA